MSMFEQMTDALDFHGRALQLRASRQETIASNIANADICARAVDAVEYAGRSA